ncbi:hypothetical protein HNR23_000480 [Nocardiopsis mwathae]|uniref:Uncharacterized protein n=1 Tax=Nocardiopsis mwathae TaxID=1472723 RepID=A0A7X0D3W0_9ACTN|nr:hypothetical protein [Nocardiopsis mwathae]MBB6170420.1 hypothetical protein [Nocardiopsis mwathae]
MTAPGDGRDGIAAALLAMAAADQRHRNLTVVLRSELPPGLDGPPAQRPLAAEGAGRGPRVRRPLHPLLDRILGTAPPRREPHPPADGGGRAILTARLRLRKPDRWRYEEIDGGGVPWLTHGCDGTGRWSLIDGELRTWRPSPRAAVTELDGTDWRQIPNRALREVLDPPLALAALALRMDTAERADAALRLTAAPHSLDIVASALAAPDARHCLLDVADSGILTAFRNLRADGSPSATHEVTALDLDADHDPALFSATR